MKQRLSIGKGYDTVINNIVLAVTGMYILFASIFKARFAELHISLPFLNFPVFVGEIVLFICVASLLAKLFLYLSYCDKTKIINLDIWRSLIMLFFIFVLAKAAYGYIKWGPLAFRNAALFYYSLFAVIMAFCFNIALFKNRFIRYILLAWCIELILICHPLPSVFFYFTYCIIAIVLLPTGIKKNILNFLIAASLILFTWKDIVSITQGRDILISIICGYAFLLIICILYFLNVRARYKAVAFFLILICALTFAAVSFRKLGDSTGLRSLFNIESYLAFYHCRTEMIDSVKDFQFKKLSTRLYHPEREESLFHEAILPPPPEKQAKLKIESQVKSIREDKNIGERVFVALPEGVTKEEFVNILTQHKPTAQEPKPMVETKPSTILPTGKTTAVADIVLETKPGPAAPKLPVEAKPLKTESVAEYKDSEGKTFVALPNGIGKEEAASIFFRYMNGKLKELSLYCRTITAAHDSAVWRILMWQDMFDEFVKGNKLVGIDFGKPFRSKRLESIRMSAGSWVGWIEPHNSYIHILYRAGLIGFLYLIVVFGIFIKLAVSFVKIRNIKGILLCSALLYWLVIANFSVILELPYFAIPFWSLLGITYGYYKQKLQLKTP